jgi:hypothetical protein
MSEMRRWSEQEIQQVVTLEQQGERPEAIAKALNRTTASVQQIRTRLRMSGKLAYSRNNFDPKQPVRNYLNEYGARVLADKIAAYWLKKGKTVKTWVVDAGNNGGPLWCVRSDIKVVK